MIDFWRKKHNRPDIYIDLIDQEGYNKFIESCLNTLRRMKIKVINVENGDINYVRDKTAEKGHFFLDNLLRKYVQLDDKEKLIEIENHFIKFQFDDNDAFNYFFKDFDYAKQFLKVLVKSKDILPNIDEFIYRTDFPELGTFLVFDYGEKFTYLRKDKAKEWQREDEDLFEVALNNIANESIEIREHTFGGKFIVYVLLSGDFSASYTLLIRQLIDFSIGRYGSIIAIPTKGTAFIHPIESNDIMELIPILYPELERFYNEDPGNISLDFYWFFNERYTQFPKKSADNNLMTISLPDKLSEMLNQ